VFPRVGGELWATSWRFGVCLELGHEPATWGLIDPATQVTEPTGRGLELVATPPPVRGGVGRIALDVDHSFLADVDLMICGPCRRAVLEQIRVDEEVRRLGYGRLLVSAALVRAPADQYRWSATETADSTEARAFWSRVPFPGTLGDPTYCTDMRYRSRPHARTLTRERSGPASVRELSLKLPAFIWPPRSAYM